MPTSVAILPPSKEGIPPDQSACTHFSSMASKDMTKKKKEKKEKAADAKTASKAAKAKEKK